MILDVPEAVWPLVAVVVLVVLLAFIFRRTIEEVLIPRVSGVKVLGLEIQFAKQELAQAIQARNLSRKPRAIRKPYWSGLGRRGPCFTERRCCGSTTSLPATGPNGGCCKRSGS